jgi:hypothetical protein
MTNVERFLLVALMLSFGSCVTPHASDSDSCEVTDINALFASPLTFHGRRFCGQGYLYSRSELTGIYSSPVDERVDPYDMAILLDATSADRGAEIPGGQNVAVFVSGQIDSATCNAAPDPNVPSCVPVVRAIFLKDWEVRSLR